MLAQQFAGLSYLALTAELQNLVMLLIGALHAVGEVELQAGVPFPVFFEIADNPLEPRLVGAGVKDGMKLPVQSPPRRNVVVPPQFTYIFAQHSCGFRKVVFCKAWNRKFQNLGLEQGANRKELFRSETWSSRRSSLTYLRSTAAASEKSSSVRRGIESFKTSGSSKARIEKSSSISSGDKAGTIAPRLGTMAIRPSASSCRKASRTGIRLTWY